MSLSRWAYAVLLGPLVGFNVFCLVWGLDDLGSLPGPVIEFLYNFGLFCLILIGVFVGASMAPLFGDAGARRAYLDEFRTELVALRHWGRRG